MQDEVKIFNHQDTKDTKVHQAKQAKRSGISWCRLGDLGVLVVCFSP
jgi:hypothetical protein